MSLKTGFIYDESYFWHDTGNGALVIQSGGMVEPDTHAENAETKRRVKNLLERSGFIKNLHSISPRLATENEIELNHTSHYVEKIKELSDTGGGDAGKMAVVGPGSYEIALLSAGGALTAVEAVMEGEAQNVYALTRPQDIMRKKNLVWGFVYLIMLLLLLTMQRKNMV
nr:hypothetical protein [Halobacillus shinanisalinarum]